MGDEGHGKDEDEMANETCLVDVWLWLQRTIQVCCSMKQNNQVTEEKEKGPPWFELADLYNDAKVKTKHNTN